MVQLGKAKLIKLRAGLLYAVGEDREDGKIVTEIIIKIAVPGMVTYIIAFEDGECEKLTWSGEYHIVWDQEL